MNTSPSSHSTIVIALSFLAFCSGTLTSMSGQIPITPVADTGLQSDWATSDFGSQPNVVARNNDTATVPYGRHIILQFDVSSADLSGATGATFAMTRSRWNLTGPTGDATAGGVELWGYVDGGVLDINAGGTGNPWTPSLDFQTAYNDGLFEGTTYATGAGNFAAGQATYLGLLDQVDKSKFAQDLPWSLSGSTGSDLLNYLKADTDGIVTLLVRRPENASIFFYSMDYLDGFGTELFDPVYRPSLTIVPEPSISAFLLGLFGVCVVILRRRLEIGTKTRVVFKTDTGFTSSYGAPDLPGQKA